MDTENADTQPSSASAVSDQRFINDVRIVSFIFIDTDADESKNVAFRVALYEPTSGERYVRWTAELRYDTDFVNHTVIAAAVVPSQDKLDALLEWIEGDERVKKVTCTKVPRGEHYDYAHGAEPWPLNGWP